MEQIGLVVGFLLVGLGSGLFSPEITDTPGGDVGRGCTCSTLFFPSPQTLFVSFGGAPDEQQKNTLLTMAKQLDALKSRAKAALREDLLGIQRAQQQVLLQGAADPPAREAAGAAGVQLRASSSAGGGCSTPRAQQVDVQPRSRAELSAGVAAKGGKISSAEVLLDNQPIDPALEFCSECRIPKNSETEFSKTQPLGEYSRGKRWCFDCIANWTLGVENPGAASIAAQVSKGLAKPFHSKDSVVLPPPELPTTERDNMPPADRRWPNPPGGRANSSASNKMPDLSRQLSQKPALQEAARKIGEAAARDNPYAWFSTDSMARAISSAMNKERNANAPPAGATTSTIAGVVGPGVLTSTRSHSQALIESVASKSMIKSVAEAAVQQIQQDKQPAYSKLNIRGQTPVPSWMSAVSVPAGTTIRPPWEHPPKAATVSKPPPASTTLNSSAAAAAAASDPPGRTTQSRGPEKETTAPELSALRPEAGVRGVSPMNWKWGPDLPSLAKTGGKQLPPLNCPAGLVLPPHVEPYAGEALNSELPMNYSYRAPDAPGQVRMSAEQRKIITTAKNGKGKWTCLAQVAETLPKHPLNLHPSRWNKETNMVFVAAHAYDKLMAAKTTRQKWYCPGLPEKLLNPLQVLLRQARTIPLHPTTGPTFS